MFLIFTLQLAYFTFSVFIEACLCVLKLYQEAMYHHLLADFLQNHLYTVYIVISAQQP